MSRPTNTTRRDFILGGVAATASLAAFVPAHVLGREGATARGGDISELLDSMKRLVPFRRKASVA